MPIRLEIGNSYSRITGLSASEEKTLRELLSYTENAKSAYFGRGYARKKSLLSKKGEFPTGLLHRLPDMPLAILDNRKQPRLHNPTLDLTGAYKWQQSAYLKSLIIERGIISAPTGTGKSKTIHMICKRFAKVLVIVPTLEIKKQMKETLTDKGIVVENIDSKALNSLVDFDCLIIDEAHHAAAKTYQKLNKTVWKDIYYRYFFSATPFRNDVEEQLLFESIAGKVIYQLDYETAIKEKYIVPIEAYYITAQKQPTEAYTYSQVYSELVVNNVSKNRQIIDILTALHTSGKSTLCLVREVKHGKILSEITGLPFVHGGDEDSRKYIQQFNSGKIKVLIGTEGVLGEGVDTRPCEYVLIASAGKAKSNFMQKCGRGVRNYPGKDSAKLILIQDLSHRYLSRHFREQCAILKAEYGVTAIKLGD